VTVDAGNRFFGICDGFVFEIVKKCVIRYFGNDRLVMVRWDTEAISASCFEGSKSISSVIFEVGCRGSKLGDCAFRGCSSLQSICLPSSIGTIPYQSLVTSVSEIGSVFRM
jgi:hypothetical protein